MSTRTLLFTWAAAGLTTLALTACDGGKDSEETGTAEADADTDTDTDTDTDADEDYFEPDAIVFSWFFLSADQQLDTTNKLSANAYFAPMLIDTQSWDGDIQSPYGHCSALISLANATVSTDLINAGATYGGWTVPGGSAFASLGECDNMDPTGQWGSAPDEYLASFDWGFGISPASGVFDDWAGDYAFAISDGWVDSSAFTGQGAAILTANASYDIATQELLDVTGQPVLPDAIHYGFIYNGFYLQ